MGPLVKNTISVLTAVGMLNLTWDIAAKSINAEHEDQSPGFAVVQASTTSISITVTVQDTITGDLIEAPRVFELTPLSDIQKAT
jgi:hypothetical protein